MLHQLGTPGEPSIPVCRICGKRVDSTSWADECPGGRPELATAYAAPRQVEDYVSSSEHTILLTQLDQLEQRLMAELELNRGSADSAIKDATAALAKQVANLARPLHDTIWGAVGEIIRRLEQTPVTIEEALGKATMDQLLEAIRVRHDQD